MTIVGYSHDPDVAVIENDAVYKSLLEFDEIKKVLPGSDFCEFEIGAHAPEELRIEIDWFVDRARQYLTATIVAGEFSSEEAYQAWFEALTPQQHEAVKGNRVHLDNMMSVSRLVAGLTTEAFAKQLQNQTIHDRIIFCYTEFTTAYPLHDFYNLSVQSRLAAAEALTLCVTSVIRLLEQVDFIKCQG